MSSRMAFVEDWVVSGRSVQGETPKKLEDQFIHEMGKDVGESLGWEGFVAGRFE